MADYFRKRFQQAKLNKSEGKKALQKSMQTSAHERKLIITYVSLRSYAHAHLFVAPAGIEPASEVSETSILSVELRSHFKLSLNTQY